MKIKQIFRDKNGNYSAREFVVTISFVWILISAASEQFFSHPVNETVFITFAGMVSAGLFGYSLENLKSFTHKPPADNRPPFDPYPEPTLQDADRDR